jgi:hypothetical protein
VSTKYTVRGPVLPAREVGVFADVGHFREHTRQRPARRLQQGCFKDLAVFGFRAALMFGGTPFQGLYDPFIEPSHHQIGHDRISFDATDRKAA